MSQYKNAKLHNVIRKWNTQQLIETLEDNGLGECSDAIRDKQIDGDTFMNLTEGQLVLWKNKLSRLQITRLWSVIQLAHERPEDFVRLDQTVRPAVPKTNIPKVTNNSLKNKLEQIKIKDEEPQELYSNHEDARFEINKLPTKPELTLKPIFNKKPNPVFPHFNNRQENQNKGQIKLPTPPVPLVNTVQTSKSTLPTSQTGNEYLLMSKSTLTTSLHNRRSDDTIGKSTLPTPVPSSLHASRQLKQGKSTLPTPPITFENNSRDSDSSQDFDDSDEDDNKTILQQMINKSPILSKMSPQNQLFGPENISQRRLPTVPPSSSYSRPLPEPPSDENQSPFRQPRPAIVCTATTPIGAGLPLPGPPIGAVPDIELEDEFDDDFDEGYEYSEMFDYKTKPWFKNVNRKEAIRLLEGASNGTFIVRPSKYEKYECSFSINYDNRIYNLAVLKHDSAFALGNSIYNTITEIVDKFCKETFILNGPNNENCYVKLKLPRLLN